MQAIHYGRRGWTRLRERGFAERAWRPIDYNRNFAMDKVSETTGLGHFPLGRLQVGDPSFVGSVLLFCLRDLPIDTRQLRFEIADLRVRPNGLGYDRTGDQ